MMGDELELHELDHELDGDAWDQLQLARPAILAVLFAAMDDAIEGAPDFCRRPYVERFDEVLGATRYMDGEHGFVLAEAADVDNIVTVSVTTVLGGDVVHNDLHIASKRAWDEFNLSVPACRGHVHEDEL